MKSDKSSRKVGFDWVKWFRCELAVMIAAYVFFANVVLANPMGAQVVSGNVSMNTQGKTLNMTNSPNSIINWQSFSIKSDETTRFIQQNAASTVLNRVQGQDPSAILGSLVSNGRVLLVNPNGIIFGQGARVDVNGFIASTLNISNQDFLSGKYNFNAGTTAGNISNQGTITTPEGGMIYLIAPNIENNGIITSPKGDVMLAAGHRVQLVDSLNPEIAVVVSAPADKALNLGQIVARGGRVGIYGNSINLRGIVNANSAAIGENGRIFFKAENDITLEEGSVTTADGIRGGKIKIQSEEGTAIVAGQVSAAGSAGQGGTIGIFGRNVGLTGNASIDASGKTGGGEVLIGGDRQGKNPYVQNAQAAFIDKDTEIKADATDNGDGGKVIVWSDEATRFYGHIFARGGQNGGNGGFVETSGHTLKIGDYARVSTIAPKGKTGEWLIDPQDFTIGTGGDILGATIATNLQGGDITILSSTGVTAGNGNIIINDNINTTADLGATRTLKLIAERDIVLEGTKKIDATLGGNTRALNVIFNADSNTLGSGGVTLKYSSAIKTNGGNIVMGGGNCTTAGCNAAAYGTGIAGTGGITIDDNDGGAISLLSGNGAIWMWGSGPAAGGAGIHVRSATINSGTTGSVYLKGEGVYDSGSMQVGNGYGLFFIGSTIIGGSGGMTLDGKAADTSLIPPPNFGPPIIAPPAIGFTGTASAYTTNGGTMTVNANSPAGGTYISTNSTDDLLGHETLQNGNIILNYTGISIGGLPNIKNPAGDLTVNSLTSGLPITDGGNGQTVSGTTFIDANNGFVALGAAFGSTFTTGTLTISNGLGIGVINTGALTLGAIDGGTDPIGIATTTGNLTLTGVVGTTNTTANAIMLNAGVNATAGTAAGGDIIVSGGSVSTGAGGRATLYSGSVAGSTGLTALIGSGSGKFRYNSDETATNYTTALGAGNYAIYREQPTVAVTALGDSKTYNGLAYNGGNGVTTSGFVNGDTAASLGGVLAYGGTSQGAVSAGSYTIVPSGYTNGLGYALAYANGTLTVNGGALQPVVSPTVIAAVNNSNSATSPTFLSTIASIGTTADISGGSSGSEASGGGGSSDKDKGGSQTSKDGDSGTKKKTLPYCN